MVRFEVDSITGGSATCGNMLVEIANNYSSGYNNSVFTGTQQIQVPYKYEYTNTDFLHPFNSGFNQSNTDYSAYFNLASFPNALTMQFDDMIGASLFNPYKTTSVNTDDNKVNKNTPVKKPKQTTSTTGKSSSNSSSGLISNIWTGIKDGVSSIGSFISGLLRKLVDFAYSFVGRVNNDREGNRLFSGGQSRAWCADFVTYCVKKAFGNKLPSDFGSPAVSGLRDWGIKHGCYSTAPEPRTAAAMKNYLKSKVKPGDIMIQKRNGRSHTGIVKSVAPDGSSYTVVEGNASDSVKTVTYQATNGYLSGFVSLSQFA